MGNRWDSRQLLASAFAALCLIGASPANCGPALGSKQPNAQPGQFAAAVDLTGYQNCDNYPAFKSLVGLLFQQSCVSCHGPGGQGSAKFQLLQGSDDTAIATNYAASLTKFNADFGNGDVEANLLLAKVNGRISHDLKLDTTGPDYLNLVTWASAEVQNNANDFCNPAAGTGTLYGGAGAAGGSAGH